MESPNFFQRNFPDKKEPNYSQKEIEFYLEILPQHKKSSLYLDDFKSEELRVKRSKLIVKT